LVTIVSRRLLCSSPTAAAGGHRSVCSRATSNAAAKSSGYALILLDWIETPVEEQVRARDAAVKALDTFTPVQKVAVYLLGEYRRLVQNFTSDLDESKYATNRAGFEMASCNACSNAEQVNHHHR
jgi:hypothetical protein